MKNILSLECYLVLFLSVILISCGGDDDDTDAGRTTDPMIGTWRSSYTDDGDDAIDELVFNAGGWYLETTLYGDDISIDTVSGNWRNTGFDFDATRQTIVLSFFPYEEDGETIQLDDQTFTWIFSNNFNTMRVEGDDLNRTYTRQ